MMVQEEPQVPENKEISSCLRNVWNQNKNRRRYTFVYNIALEMMK